MRSKRGSRFFIFFHSMFEVHYPNNCLPNLLREALSVLSASAFRFGKRQRKKFQGSRRQFQEKTEEARSAAADSSAVQNMDDDPAT
jgi:hypothetical protein